MSSSDIWYFVRDQETVGPFSKEVMQQIHEGGQLPIETLVWREGMASWQPVSTVTELDIPKKSPTPEASTASTGSATASAPAAPVAEKPRLRLKAKDPAPSPSAPGAPLHIPAPLAPRAPAQPAPAPESSPAPQTPAAAAPSMGLVTEKPGEEPKQKKTKKEETDKPPLLQRIIQTVFSSLLLTPLFLIISGGVIYLHQTRFPNILWFVWLTAGFGIYGILSLLRFHMLDGLFRLLAFLFLLPPIVLFWPVIMNEQHWKTASVANWAFLGFCFLYFLTVRVGLNVYISRGFGIFAGLTGILTLACIGVAARTDLPSQKIDGWTTLVEKGGNIRLPGILARLINHPELGTEVGFLQLGTGDQGSRHGLESARLKAATGTEYRLILQTLDDIHLFARFTVPEGAFDAQKLIGQEGPISFSKDGDTSGDDATHWNWTTPTGKKREVTSATLKIESIQDDTWRGSISFQLTPEAGSQAAADSGNFETRVTVEAAKPR